MVNLDFSDPYNANTRIILDPARHQFIHEKLLSECSMGRISRTDKQPQCTHNAFCVEKSSDSGQLTRMTGASELSTHTLLIICIFLVIII